MNLGDLAKDPVLYIGFLLVLTARIGHFKRLIAHQVPQKTVVRDTVAFGTKGSRLLNTSVSELEP
jgi:hypothetical protein